MSERINRIIDDQIIFIMTQTQKFQSVLIINTDSFICQSAGIVREKFFTDFNKNAVRLDHINFFDFFIMAQLSCHTAVPAADHQDIFHTWMNCHRHMNDHLIINKLIFF